MKEAYYKGTIDKFPVKVKIIQIRKRKSNTGEDISRVEISRDFNSNAGFWVDMKELNYAI